MGLINNKYVIQTLSSQRPYPSLSKGVGIGRFEGGADDVDTF